MALERGEVGPTAPFLTATQAISAEFDMGLDVLQAPGNLSVPANGYLPWPLPTGPGTADIWLHAIYASSSCSYRLALLSSALYQTFQTNRSAIYSPSAIAITGLNSTPCTNSTEIRGSGFFNGGPYDLTPGETLVFFNGGPYGSVFAVFDSIEMVVALPS